MTLEFELSYNPSSTWDNEILNNEFPEIFQTSKYGEFIQNSGKRSGYITIYDNGNLVGNCLIEISKEKICSWAYGPIIKSELIDRQEEIIIQLFGFLRRNGFIAVEKAKTQKDFTGKRTLEKKAGLYSRIGESPYIDIRPEMEEILSSFDRSVRKNVNKCLRNGVEILLYEDTSLLEPYLEMLSWFRLNRNFGMPSFFPNAQTMGLFNSPITSMGIALAKYDNKYLAGMGFVTIGNMMTEIAMATSKDYELARLPINDFIKVKAIEFYKSKGIELYDLAGGEKNPTDPKKLSILTFKQKFASNNAPFAMIDRKILSPRWYIKAFNRKINYSLMKKSKS
jgi:hypothetical protein